MEFSFAHPFIALVWVVILLLIGGLFFRYLAPSLAGRVYAQAGSAGLLFVSYVVGVCVLVTVGAAYFTGFQTVFLGFVFLFALLAVWSRSLAPSPLPDSPPFTLSFRKVATPDLLVLLVLFLWASGWVLVGMMDIGTLRYTDIQQDNFFYSKVSVALREGKETLIYDALYDDSYGPYPYHYFEMWMGIIPSLGHQLLPPFLSFSLLSAQLLVTGMLLGIYALARLYLRNTWASLAITLALFGGGVLYLVLDTLSLGKITDNSLVIILSTGTSHGAHLYKYTPIALFLLFPWLLQRISGQWLPAMLIAAFSLFLNAAALPLVGTLCVLGIWLVYTNWHLKHYRVMGGLTVLSLLYYGCFYLLSAGVTLATDSAFPELPNLQTRLMTGLHLATSINIVGKTVFQIGLAWFPLWLLLAVAIQRKLGIDKWYALVVMLLFVASSLGWVLLRPIVPSDAIQFFTVSFVPVCFLLLWDLVPRMLAHSPARWIRGGIILLLLGFCVQFGLRLHTHLAHTHGWRNSFAYEAAFFSAPLHRGAYLHNMDKQKGTSWFQNHLRVAMVEVLTMRHPTALPPIPLADLRIRLPDDPTTAWAVDHMRRGQLFFRYFYAQKAAQPDITPQQAMAQFIQDKNIDYLIVESGGTLPHTLRPLVKQMHHDSTGTGDKLYLLK